jgi:hypothetical protein
MIDPNSTNTIRVGELPIEPFSLTDNIPHEVGTELKRGTVQQLSDFIATVIEVTGGVGFRAVTVTDGQTLPTTTQQEFILVGKGTYFNVSGGDTIVLTEELNALVSNGSFWFVGVEIPVNVELAGITQFVREGFQTTAPSEDAVFGALENLDLRDVILATNFASLPITGQLEKIYITIDDNKIYRFNGTIYVPLGGSLTSTATQNFIPKVNAGGNLVNSSLVDDNGVISTSGSNNLLAITNSGAGVYGLKLESTSVGLFEAIAIKGGPSLSSSQQGLIGQRDNGEFFFFNQADAPISFNTNGIQRMQVNTIGLDVTGKATVSGAPINANDVVRKTELDLKANLASPTFTGVPTSPTAAAGTNTTQIATTAFVQANSNAGGLLEFNLTDRTIWNNGKGDFSTNTSFGDSALKSITVNGNETAYGNQSLLNLVSGTDNTAIGRQSGAFTSVGNLTISNNSIFLGSFTKSLNDSENNQIVIGYNATGAGSNTATLGNTSITKTVLRGTVEAGNGTALNHLVTKAQTLYTNQTITENKTVAIAEFVNNNELILSVNATSGNITITLPTFTALQGYKVTVKKMDSSANSVLIQGVGGINIDGSASVIISGQYSSSTIGANLQQYIIL